MVMKEESTPEFFLSLFVFFFFDVHTLIISLAKTDGKLHVLFAEFFE